jgi:hypothetical protein
MVREIADMTDALVAIASAATLVREKVDALGERLIKNSPCVFRFGEPEEEEEVK